MTLRVLEFNDAGIRVSDDSGVLLSSPGYALVNGKRIEFGEHARKQSRLNPLNCYNQFWHKLNLDPFARPVAHYRHNADIAFSHLQDLAAATELKGDVLLAVPGSFSRQQLAILLGLIKQCSFRAVGIVDAGLAAAIDQTHSDSVIHADLQLHQVVLSKLTRQGGELVLLDNAELDAGIRVRTAAARRAAGLAARRLASPRRRTKQCRTRSR